MSKTILANVNGFTPVIDSVVLDVGLTSATVFGKMWRYCQMADGVCKAKQERIAQELGLSRATVNSHIEKLIKKGYLKDTTPELTGLPHVYADTGKAGLSISLTASEQHAQPVEIFDTPCKNSLQAPVKILYTKKELKKEKESLGANPAPTPAPDPTQTDRTGADVQGDAIGADPATALQSLICEYPQDCQQTLTWLIELFAWSIGAIPAKPQRGSKGGAYAQWINELRDIDRIIAGVGRPALEAAKTACANLSISHPAGINWCLAGEVGKIIQYREKHTTQTSTSEIDMASYLRTYQPRQSA